MSIPAISVIMPVYNCAGFIETAIESILNQTFGNFELIIIDDGSTDDTGNKAARYTDQRIRFYRQPVNKGLIACLNLALSMAGGRYIARMDGDDISHLSRFERQVFFLDANPGIVLCGSSHQVLSTGAVVGYPQKQEDIKIAMLEHCAFAHPTVMFRRIFFSENGLTYNPVFEAAEDYELWTRAIAIGNGANLPDVLLYYRDHEGQVSNKMSALQYENTLLCKINMLCLPLGAVTAPDKHISETVVKTIPASNRRELAVVLAWLDKLAERNKSTGQYQPQKFEAYIHDKKSSLIAAFYINARFYNPGMLYDFLKLNTGYKLHLSTHQFFKIIAKCIIFWHKGAA